MEQFSNDNLFHITNDFVKWCKIACHVKQNCSTWIFLLHRQCLRPLGQWSCMDQGLPLFYHSKPTSSNKVCIKVANLTNSTNSLELTDSLRHSLGVMGRCNKNSGKVWSLVIHLNIHLFATFPYWEFWRTPISEVSTVTPGWKLIMLELWNQNTNSGCPTLSLMVGREFLMVVFNQQNNILHWGLTF